MARTEAIYAEFRSVGGEKVVADLQRIGGAATQAADQVARAGPRMAPGLAAVDRAAQQVRRSLDDATGRLGVLGSALQALGPGGVVVGAATAGLAGLAAAAIRASRAASEISDASQRMGVSAETWQVLRYAADQTGVSMAALEAAIGRLNRTMIALRTQTGGTELAKLDRVMAQQLRTAGSLEEAWARVTERLRALRDPSEQVALAYAVLGRHAQQLLPLLLDSTRTFAEFRAEAERLGVVISSDLIAAGDAADDAVARLAATVRSQLLRALLELAPQIEWTAQKLAEMAAGIGRVLGTSPSGLQPMGARAREIVAEMRQIEAALAERLAQTPTGAAFPAEAAEDVEQQRQRLRALQAELVTTIQHERTLAAAREQLASADLETTRRIRAVQQDAARELRRSLEERERLVARVVERERDAAQAGLEGEEAIRAAQARRIQEWAAALQDLEEREALLARAAIAEAKIADAEIAALRATQATRSARDDQQRLREIEQQIDAITSPLTRALDSIQDSIGDIFATLVTEGTVAFEDLAQVGRQIFGRLVGDIASMLLRVGIVEPATRAIASSAQHWLPSLMGTAGVGATTGATGASLAGAAAVGGYAAAIIGAIVNTLILARERGSVAGRTPTQGWAMAGAFPPAAAALFGAQGDWRAALLTSLFPPVLAVQAAGVDVLGIAPSRRDYQRQLWSDVIAGLRRGRIPGAWQLGDVRTGTGVGRFADLTPEAIAFGGAIAGLRGGGGGNVFAASMAREAERAALDVRRAMRALGLTAAEAWAAIQRTFDGGRDQAVAYREALRGVVGVYADLRGAARDAVAEMLAAQRVGLRDIRQMRRATRASVEILGRAAQSPDLVEALGTALTETVQVDILRRVLASGSGRGGILTGPILAVRRALRQARRPGSPGGTVVELAEIQDAIAAASAQIPAMAGSLGQVVRDLRAAVEAGPVFAARLQAAAGDLGAAATMVERALHEPMALRDRIIEGGAALLTRFGALSGDRALQRRVAQRGLQRARQALASDVLLGPLLPAIEGGWAADVLAGSRFTAATPEMLSRAWASVTQYLEQYLAALDQERGIYRELIGVHRDVRESVRGYAEQIAEVRGGLDRDARAATAVAAARAQLARIDWGNAERVRELGRALGEASQSALEAYRTLRADRQTLEGIADQALLARGGRRGARQLLAARQAELGTVTAAARLGDARALARLTQLLPELLSLAPQALGDRRARGVQSMVEALAREFAAQLRPREDEALARLDTVAAILGDVGGTLDTTTAYLQAGIDALERQAAEAAKQWAAVVEALERTASTQLADALARLNALLADGPDSLRDVLRRLSAQLGMRMQATAGPMLSQATQLDVAPRALMAMHRRY